LAQEKLLDSAADALAFRPTGLGEWLRQGVQPVTFAGEVLRRVSDRRMSLWRERVKKVNWELFDQGVLAFTTYALEEWTRAADRQATLFGAPRGQELARFAGVAAVSAADVVGVAELAALRDQLAEPFAGRVSFWPRQSGPKGDLVDDEMSRVLQVPGWSNI